MAGPCRAAGSVSRMVLAESSFQVYRRGFIGARWGPTSDFTPRRVDVTEMAITLTRPPFRFSFSF